MRGQPGRDRSGYAGGLGQPLSGDQCRVVCRGAIAHRYRVFESRLGPRHQCDCECGSTGADGALLYFSNGNFVIPGYAICGGSHIDHCKLKRAWRASFAFLGGHAEASCP